MIKHGRRKKNRAATTTNRTYLFSSVIKIFSNDLPSHDGDLITFKVMASTLPLGTIGSVVTLFPPTIDCVNYSRYVEYCDKVSSLRSRNINNRFRTFNLHIVVLFANTEKCINTFIVFDTILIDTLPTRGAVVVVIAW
jgi:hypothetical protein